MGCGASNSKLAAVAPEQAPKQAPKSDSNSDSNRLSQSSSNSKLLGSKQVVRLHSRNAWTDNELNNTTSQTSNTNIIHVQGHTPNESKSETDFPNAEDTSVGSRTTSATSSQSKTSASSKDSGLELDYPDMITENSDVQLQRIAELSDSLNVPDLTIDGVSVSSATRRSNPKKKVTLSRDVKQPELPPGQKHVTFSEELISDLPDSPSIIKRPVSRGGLAFDIVMGNDIPTPRQRPVLSSKRRQKLSYEELQEKQRVAAQRKKEHEQLVIERIRAKEERDRQVKEALDRFAEMQTELAKLKKKKEEATFSNREAHLNSIKDRLKDKSENVDQIKAAKKVRKLAPLTGRPPRPDKTTENVPVNLGAN